MKVFSAAIVGFLLCFAPALSLRLTKSNISGEKDAKVLVGCLSWALEDSWHLRKPVVRKTLETVKQWPAKSTILMVSNKEEDEFKDLVDMSFIADENTNYCGGETYSQLRHCASWKLIELMKNAAAERDFNYFAYIEDDMVVPTETFNFFKSHVDYLHDNGYLLTTLRVSAPELDCRKPGRELVSDCANPPCVAPFLDASGAEELYTDKEDRVYLRSTNPYSATWLMNTALWEEYVNGPQSNFTTWTPVPKENRASLAQVDTAEHVPRDTGLGIREMAASGLTYDPRYGSKKQLTHIKMKVYHASEDHHVTDELSNCPVGVDTQHVYNLVDGCSANQACEKLI